MNSGNQFNNPTQLNDTSYPMDKWFVVCKLSPWNMQLRIIKKEAHKRSLFLISFFGSFWFLNLTNIIETRKKISDKIGAVKRNKAPNKKNFFSKLISA